MEIIETVAVVTGASSGIGAAIVKQLLRAGMKVVGLARRKELIQDLSTSTNLYAIECDVSEESNVVKAFQWTTTNIGPVSVLVNCAGIYGRCDIIDGDCERWRAMLNTNVLSYCVAIKEGVRIMKEHKTDGYIINIGSILGNIIIDYPDQTMYSATKHAIRALSEHIRLELSRAKSKIRITNLSPGLVKTDIFKVGKELSDDMNDNIFKERAYILPEDIASAVMYLLQTKPTVLVSELTIRAVGEGQ